MQPGAVVIVYSGHMFEAGSEEEPLLARRVNETLEAMGVAEAFGPLACGGDMLIAEAVIARGGKLNVVLPFAEADFIDQSVVCGGEAWLPRFKWCRQKAASVHFATPGAYVDDDNQFSYATRLAMGLAALRAREIGSEPVQVAILDKSAKSFSKSGLAGTSADTEAWRRLGKETIIIHPGKVGRQLRFPPPLPRLYDAKRAIRSILFADYKGFSALGERELPVFMRETMGVVGQVLDEFGAHVEFRNTWGDALYAIVDQPEAAARLALSLQGRLAAASRGLSSPVEGAGMRIGLHFGPIYHGADRVTHGPLWYGGEVNRTARIEPVTPVGGVYCTETFAAALVLAGGDDECTLTPVGEKQLPKNFGNVALYQLTEKLC